jgi:hypothetical protein|tara:strand:- start:494 stop:670 length:177 start_codon:yes stop_codon:yes gene_type:complete
MRDIVNNIDQLLMMNICMDLINGTLLTQEDDETLELVMVNMYDDMTRYEELGVIIGKS